MQKEKYKRLGNEGRESISRGLAQKRSIRAIAREINRSASTVTREINRNRVRADIEPFQQVVEEEQQRHQGAKEKAKWRKRKH